MAPHVAVGKDEPMPTLTLAKPELLFLAGYLRQLTRWSVDAAVRVQGRGTVAGFYGAPLDEVITLISLPVGPLDADFDVTVSAGRLRDVIGDVRNVEGATTLTLPDEVSVPPILNVLPPTSGWSPPFLTTAGDLAAQVDPQIEKLSISTQVLPESKRADHMRDRWVKP